MVIADKEEWKAAMHPSTSSGDVSFWNRHHVGDDLVSKQEVDGQVGAVENSG